MTLTRHSLVKCRTKDCPFTPDQHGEWMELCSRAPEHGHRHDQPTHQHIPKKGMGGNNPLSKIRAIICWPMHDRIDNGDFGNTVDLVYRDGEKVEEYRAFDLHGKTLIEHEVLSDGAEAGNAPPQGAAPTPSASSPSTKEESDGEEAGARVREDVPEGKARGDTATGRPARDVAGGGDGDRGGPLVDRGDGDTSSPLTHEQRVAIAQEIKDAKQRHPFFAGDTANLWEEQLGEDFWNIYANEFGYTYPSLRNVMRVCKRIPPGQRHVEMSFAHHEVVQSFDIETREAWLERAFEEEWPVKRLREELVVEGLLTAKPKTRKWSLEELRAEYAGWMQALNPSEVRPFLDYLEVKS